jgi:hypothetical protein
MIDFIGKILFKRKPEEIQNDNPQDINKGQLAIDSTDSEGFVVASALVAHLNEILDWKDRVDAIDYLAAEAIKTAGNPTYYTKDEQLVNAILAINGSGNTVDLELVKVAMGIVFDMYDVMALSAVTDMN